MLCTKDCYSKCGLFKLSIVLMMICKEERASTKRGDGALLQSIESREDFLPGNLIFSCAPGGKLLKNPLDGSLG